MNKFTLLTTIILFFAIFTIVKAQTTPVILTPLNVTFSGVLSSKSNLKYGPPLQNITEYYNYQVLPNGELTYYVSQLTYPQEKPAQSLYLLLRTDLGKLKYVWTWSNERNCVLKKGLVAFTFVELLNQQLENSTYIGEEKIPFGSSSSTTGDLWQQNLPSFIMPNSSVVATVNRLYVSPTNSSYISFIGSLNAMCDCQQSDCSIACQSCESDPKTCATSLLYQAPMTQFDYEPIPSSVLDIPSFCPQPNSKNDIENDFITWEKEPIPSSLELLRELAFLSSDY